MAVVVIDGFKIVKVKKKQGALLLEAFGPANGFTKSFKKSGSVVQRRQGVVGSHIEQTLLKRFLAADIPGDPPESDRFIFIVFDKGQ